MTHLFRKLEEKIACSICIGGAILASLMLIFIIGVVFLKGLPSLSWYFISTPESVTPGIGMGIANAIIGSILISIFATIFATPLALGTAIYLQKYAPDTKLTRSFRFLIEALAGIPSIVLGIFALLVFAYYMKFYTGGLSLLSGSIALAILILPVIERSIEDAIARVPPEYEEGSYALGASKIHTIVFMVIPCCLPGILTGMILGFGRAAEESAVVILTAGYSQFMPEFAIKNSDKLFAGIKVYPLQDLVGTLPYAVYHAYENSNVIPMSNGFAAAFILICVVLIINFVVKITVFLGSRTAKSPSPLLSSLNRSFFGGNGRFSRLKPVPAPTCAVAEIAAAERNAQIRPPPKTANPVKITASPISTTAELDWRETLSSGLRQGPVTGPASGATVTVDEASADTSPCDSLLDPPDAPLPIEADLFEDEPVLVPGTPGTDPESALAALEAAFWGEPVLLEEEPLSRVVEVATDEPWRRMTKNRLENTIAGVTSDPLEGP